MERKLQPKATMKKPLYFLSVAELLVGTILFILSFFVSAYNEDYILTYIGIGILQGGIYTFGIGLAIMMLEEYEGKKVNIQE